MLGKPASALSDAVFTSTTPCDLPTCAGSPFTVSSVSTTAAPIVGMRILLPLLVPESVRQSNQSQLNHDPRRQRRRRLGLEHLHQQRASRDRRVALELELDVRLV